MGTSHRGDNIDTLNSLPPFRYTLYYNSACSHIDIVHACCRHVLVVLGGVQGLEHSLSCDPSLHVDHVSLLFHHYLNMCPSQGSATIRTEVGVVKGVVRVALPYALRWVWSGVWSKYRHHTYYVLGRYTGVCDHHHVCSNSSSSKIQNINYVDDDCVAGGITSCAVFTAALTHKCKSVQLKELVIQNYFHVINFYVGNVAIMSLSSNESVQY